jgi:hypothetical protein
MSDSHDFEIECFVYRSDPIRAREIRSSNRTLSSLQPRSSVNRASAIILHLIYVSGLFGRRLQPARMWPLSRYNDLPHQPRASSPASAHAPSSASATCPVSSVRRAPAEVTFIDGLETIREHCFNLLLHGLSFQNKIEERGHGLEGNQGDEVKGHIANNSTGRNENSEKLKRCQERQNGAESNTGATNRNFKESPVD